MALKFISRSIGKFLISFSITFFILTSLAISLSDNTNTLRSSLSSALIIEPDTRTINALEILTPPTTVRALVGVVVPIPTLPVPF